MPLRPGERAIWALLLDPRSPRFLDFPDPSWPKPRTDGQDETPFLVQFLGRPHKDVCWGWAENLQPSSDLGQGPGGRCGFYSR